MGAIAAKAIFLVYLTFQPNGAVNYQYLSMHGTAQACFAQTDMIMGRASADWTKEDAGCTHVQPPKGHAGFVADETFADNDDWMWIKRP